MLPRGFRLRLGLGLLERHGATGDLDDLVLDGGDVAFHAGPDADGEAVVYRLPYLLPEGDLVALRDQRGGRLEEPAAERDAHALHLADERDHPVGLPGLDGGVLLGGDAPGDDEEAVGGAPHVGIALTERLYAHLVQVGTTVDDREVAGLGIDVHARQLHELRGGGTQRHLEELELEVGAEDLQIFGRHRLAEEERVVDVEERLGVVDDVPGVERETGALVAVGQLHAARYPLPLVLVEDVLDERLLLAHRVLVGHVHDLVETVRVLVVTGEPLLVLEVYAHDHFLDPEDRLHRVEERKELVEVLPVEHLVSPVAWLRLGAVHYQVRLRVLPLEVGRETTAAGSNDAGLAHDLHGLVPAQGLYLVETALLQLSQDPSLRTLYTPEICCYNLRPTITVSITFAPLCC